MINLRLDKYLQIANDEKAKRGLENYIPLYSMLRIEGNKLFVTIPFVNESDSVWSDDQKIIPAYWMIIDPISMNIIEFNKTSEKSFITGDIIQKNINNNQIEISKYIVNKTLEYKQYIEEDIKNDQMLLFQKKVSDSLNNVIKVDNEEININDYLFANIKEKIDNKVSNLVDLLVQTKYETITFYYDILFDSIINEYNEKDIISKEKIETCFEIIDSYYNGVIGIGNLFNM